MALHYQQKTRAIHFTGEEQTITVETVQRGDTVSAQELVNQIHLNTLLPEGVISSVLEALTKSLEVYFTQGHGCYIGRPGKDENGLGILYPKLVRQKVKTVEVDEHGEHVHNADGTDRITTATHLSVGVGFRPSTAFKAILDTISVKDITRDDDDDSTTTPSGGGTPGTGGSVTPPVDSGEHD